uniref:glycosyltransferase n=1 Tax=Stenotrophomonas maltophilia TaxID=40324 RepID=UPI0013DAECE3
VHSHRFTFEGIAAWMVARATRAALFFSVRGEVEGKVFSTKPTYRPLFRRMARDAPRILYVAAWFRRRFEAVTGVDPARTRLLPNIVFNTRPLIPATQPEKRIVCAMTLTAIDKKGLPELLAAFARVAPGMPGVGLD